MTELERTAKRAVEHFGAVKQCYKAIEELGELSSAIAKYHLGGFEEAVIEEVADCYIMLEQLRVIYDSEKINAMIGFKLARLNQTIEARQNFREALEKADAYLLSELLPSELFQRKAHKHE